MAIPDIFIQEATRNTPEPDFANSSTLDTVSDLVNDSTKSIDRSFYDFEKSENFTEPLTQEEDDKIIIGIHLRHKSYFKSVLLTDPTGHPSKIIHLPSSRDLDKVRGFLVPKDFHPEPDCKRKDLPPETVPLKCQHPAPDSGTPKKRGSCTVHGSDLHCTC